MGLFENVVRNKAASWGMEELQNVLQRKMKELQDINDRLEASPIYAREAEKVEKNLFCDFTSYFDDKGFEVVTKSKEGRGVQAAAGDFLVEVTILSAKQYRLETADLDCVTIGLLDVNEDKRTFKGYERDGEVYLVGETVEMVKKPEQFRKAIQAIEADLKLFNAAFIERYTPQFSLYIQEKDLIVDCITDYLEMVNSEFAALDI
ncbi:hypothetical protein HNO89_003500 [Sporosarcina luteola]|nr:hypothetical protein [Sporosarcina luteola]